MPSRPKHPCNRPACKEITTERFCELHKKKNQQEQDQHRGSAQDRGYTHVWSKYSKAFLNNADNVFCKLQLPGCTNLAKCVDHIEPSGPNDPMFWKPSNHQAACIHCNSVKGHTKIVGEGKPFEARRMEDEAIDGDDHKGFRLHENDNSN